MNFCTRTAIALLLVGLATGCGQSDLSDNQPYLENPPPAPPPTRLEISAISAQPVSVRPGQTVLLSVSVAPATAIGVAYSWKASGGSFGDAKANPASWTAPATDGNYALTVDVSNQNGTARGYLNVVVSVSAPRLLLSTISPSEAKTGDTVTLEGAGFGAAQSDSIVSFGSIAATGIVMWADNKIEVQVPAQAASGDVTVTVAGSASNAGKITVLWPAKSPDNLALTDSASEQRAPAIMQDGPGGAWVIWQDMRNGSADIFAQRLGANGARLWTADAIAINGSAGEQISPKVVTDGANGVIVVWEDYRSGNADIYAQRINADGNPVWDAAGIPLVTATENQLAPQIVADGAGGAIVVWDDHRSGNGDIYAQRVDASGVVQWVTDGVPVSATAGHQFAPKAATDGAGGVFVVWEDFRSGTDYDIYGQRLDSSGAAAWTPDGLVITNAQQNQLSPEIVVDGSLGVIVVWEDYRGTASDIYAQRINGAGAMSWAANGVVVSAGANNQRSPRIVSDDAGGAFVVWEDYRSGNADIYAQHVDGAGARQWAAHGTVVSVRANAQVAPRLILDHAGGIIVAWSSRGETDVDVYAQRISSSGAVLWTTSGVAVSDANGDQSSSELVEDGSDGAVLVWTDGRDTTARVYAQGVSASGRQ